jgi:hypothetical protein
MQEFNCRSCKQGISIEENQRPWVVYDVVEAKEVPLCIACINRFKPTRFWPLGGIPVLRWTEPIDWYSTLATGEKAQELRQKIFGKWA